MMDTLELLRISGIAAVVTMLSLPLISWLCRKATLVDRPAAHKRNVQPVPLSGGISIVLVASVTLLLLGEILDTWWYLCALWSLALMGIVDDRLPLPAIPRLILQALIVAYFVVHMGEARIVTLGPVFAGGTAINFSPVASYVFTTLCVLALINAFNMLDGIDGLAGTLFCVMTLGFWYLASPTVMGSHGGLFAVFIGATAGFLVYNLRSPLSRRARSYLGDTGSLTLSTLLAILAIRTTQPESSANPTHSPLLAMWVLALPIMELASATLRRLLKHQNVMQADRGHIHHRLTGWGLGVSQSVLVINLLAVGIIALGIYLDSLGIRGLSLFAICMAIYLLYLAVMNWPSKKRRIDTENQAVYSGK